MSRGSVALTGFMGAGKSTIGRALSVRLGVPFVDLDAVIEAAHGPIGEQFARDGEAAFRRREAEALAALCDGVPRVLALGGGAYVAADNRVTLRPHYLTVFLDAPLDVIEQRVGGQPGRPLWDDAVVERFRARRPMYAMADLTIDATGSVDEVVARIEEAL